MFSIFLFLSSPGFYNLTKTKTACTKFFLWNLIKARLSGNTELLIHSFDSDS